MDETWHTHPHDPRHILIRRDASFYCGVCSTDFPSPHPPEVLAEMQAPKIPAASMGEQAAALVNRIVDAWVDPGIYPGYHRASQDRLRREWPVLAQAVEDLAAYRRSTGRQ